MSGVYLGSRAEVEAALKMKNGAARYALTRDCDFACDLIARSRGGWAVAGKTSRIGNGAPAKSPGCHKSASFVIWPIRTQR